MKTSDTPRTDAAYSASTGAGIYELFKAAQEIERELSAAKASLAALEADNEHLTQVIAAHRTLADAHRELLARADTERSKAIVVVRQVSDALDRLEALEAQAKQARDDEAWALGSAVIINPAGSSESFAPTCWSVSYWDGVRTLEESAPTIAAALRALRQKVEGGKR